MWKSNTKTIPRNWLETQLAFDCQSCLYANKSMIGIGPCCAYPGKVFIKKSTINELYCDSRVQDFEVDVGRVSAVLASFDLEDYLDIIEQE